MVGGRPVSGIAPVAVTDAPDPPSGATGGPSTGPAVGGGGATVVGGGGGGGTVVEVVGTVVDVVGTVVEVVVGSVVGGRSGGSPQVPAALA